MGRNAPFNFILPSLIWIRTKVYWCDSFELSMWCLFIYEAVTISENVNIYINDIHFADHRSAGNEQGQGGGRAVHIYDPRGLYKHCNTLFLQFIQWICLVKALSKQDDVIKYRISWQGRNFMSQAGYDQYDPLFTWYSLDIFCNTSHIELYQPNTHSLKHK